MVRLPSKFSILSPQKSNLLLIILYSIFGMILILCKRFSDFRMRVEFSNSHSVNVFFTEIMMLQNKEIRIPHAQTDKIKKKYHSALDRMKSEYLSFKVS